MNPYDIFTNVYLFLGLLHWHGGSTMLPQDNAWKNSEGHVQLFQAAWRIRASVNQPSLAQIMACRLVGTKPLSEPMLEYRYLEH